VSTPASRARGRVFVMTRGGGWEDLLEDRAHTTFITRKSALWHVVFKEKGKINKEQGRVPCGMWFLKKKKKKQGGSVGRARAVRWDLGDWCGFQPIRCFLLFYLCFHFLVSNSNLVLDFKFH
jgi:hypothetical protein